MLEQPLIAALSTAPGVGGIAIVRLSGDGAWALIKKIFVAKNPLDWENATGFGLHYGHIRYMEKTYDEVLVALMRAGASYTGEEMAEIQCHGGMVSANRILKLLFALGASLASAGEFTKRAFLSGRLDLSQAEAVIEAINAQGERDLDFSLRRLEGQEGKTYLSIRDDILALVAETEAIIDFPEDGLDNTVSLKIKEKAEKMTAALKREIKKAEEGRIFKEGIRTVILGRTNVGKSSLLNALLKEERAIVTDIPGTTRDTIEETALINGVPLKIIDTAGIRETDDVVERIGVDKSRSAMEKADLILLVLDCSEALTEEDMALFAAVKDKKTIVLLNKCDMIKENKQMEAAVSPLPYFFVSAKEGLHLDAVGETVNEMFFSGAIAQNTDEWVGNLRHKEAFLKAKYHLEEAISAVEAGMPLDFQVIDLRSALEALGEISGETISNEIIDRIFSDFCIGK